MTQLTLNIKLKLKNETELKEQLVNYLENHKKLKPVRFGYTTEYAESLEYGTCPRRLIRRQCRCGCGR